MGRPRKTMDFGSKAKYEAWLRYDKWKDGGKPSDHPVNVKIQGKEHFVNHAHCGHCHDTYGKCGPHCQK